MENSQQAPLPHGFTRRQIAFAITPRFQELILFPTEKCNFRCTYCYEDFELGRMSEPLQRAVELFIANRVPNLRKLRISWFGGEPLLAKDIVLRISRFAHQLCKEHDVEFEGGLTTNAYNLDDDTAQELLACNQNFFQITFDGWKEAHDQLRKRADGKGTFDVIWGNLLSLKTRPEDFSCCVRVHVRRDNLDNLREFLHQFAYAFRGDPRFYFDFEHLRDMGGAGGATVQNPITRSELPVVEAELREVYEAELNRVLGNDAWSNALQVDSRKLILARSEDAGESANGRALADFEAGEPYICYAARPNSLLIRSNGRIGKCTVALEDTRNDIGYLDDDGQIIVNNEKMAPWIRGLGTLDVVEAGCPLRGLPQDSLPSPIKGNKRVMAVHPV